MSEETTRDKCLEHSGISSKLNLLIWLVGGNGALLSIILAFMITAREDISIGASKLDDLERRVAILETYHTANKGDTAAVRRK